MKLLNKWMNDTPIVLKRGLVAMAPLLRPSVGPAGIALAFDRSEIDRNRPPEMTAAAWKEFVAAYFYDPHSRAQRGFELINFWTAGHALRDGLKVYCPTVAEFEALARVEMRVPWSAYRQPFASMVVAVPDGAELVEPGQSRPVCVVIRHDDAAGVVAAVVPTVAADGRPGDTLSGHYCVRANDPRSIEDYIAGLPDDPSVSADEDRLVNRLIRVAINANLLLTNKGARRIGAANPAHEARLRKSLGKKSLPEAARRANEEALRSMPVIYGFEQSVRVYEREGFEGGTGGASACGVRPHWRRGHWAHQPHGPAGSLRKLVFRPAVLVNAERFGGDLADTKAVYTTGEAA